MACTRRAAETDEQAWGGWISGSRAGTYGNLCEAYGILQTRMHGEVSPAGVTPANKLQSHVTNRVSRMHLPSGVF
jgi:hypothetical protein